MMARCEGLGSSRRSTATSAPGWAPIWPPASRSSSSPCPSSWRPPAWPGCRPSPASTRSSPAACSSRCSAPTRRCRSAATPPSRRSSPPVSPPSRSPAHPTTSPSSASWPSWSGVLVMLVSLLRLGWIAEFLSTPIVTGFLSGVAVIIIVHQLPDFLGLSAVSGTNQRRIGEVVTHLGRRQRMDGGHRRRRAARDARLPPGSNRRIPGALIGLVVSTVAGRRLRSPGARRGRPRFVHDRRPVGRAPRALVVGPPESGAVAAVVALVIVTQTAATTRAFAEQGGYDVDVGRDFLGRRCRERGGGPRRFVPRRREPAANRRRGHGRRSHPGRRARGGRRSSCS